MFETYIPSSSHIDRVDHESETGVLTVTFKDGRQYEYSGVPITVFQAFQHARSAGEFFQRQVKGRYPAEEV